MRFPILLGAVLAAAPLHAAEILPGPYRADVLRVIDGDTFEARVRVWLGQDVTTRVRLRGIDAPELKGECAPAGQAARDWLEHLLRGGTVTLTAIGMDHFGGRTDASAALADGTDVAQALLASGHARLWADRRERCGR